jgi:hypothetical protein
MNTMMDALELIGKPYNPELFANLAPFKPIVRDNIIVDIYSRDMDCYENIMSMSLYNPNQLFRGTRIVADFNTLRGIFEIYSELIGTTYTNIEDIRKVFSTHGITVDKIEIIRTSSRDKFSDRLFKCNRYKILVNHGRFICRILRG